MKYSKVCSATIGKTEKWIKLVSQEASTAAEVRKKE